MHLLDGNVLVALISQAHMLHAAAQGWFTTSSFPFATCPNTQGALLRRLLRLGDVAPGTAVEALTRLVAHTQHHFWPDAIGCAEISWRGVLGHGQVAVGLEEG